MRTKIFPKINSKLTYYGSNWIGAVPIVAIKQIEDISDYNSGYGRIGNLSKQIVLTNIVGSSATPLKEGVDFIYGKRLDASIIEDPIDGYGTIEGGIIDSNISGDLDVNKIFRIVDASTGVGVNLNNSLKVYATRFENFLPSKSDVIYFDPISLKFILPRPILWCTYESAQSVLTPKIGPNGNISGEYGGRSIKFGKGLASPANTWMSSWFVLPYTLSQFSASFWMEQIVTGAPTGHNFDEVCNFHFNSPSGLNQYVQMYFNRDGARAIYLILSDVVVASVVAETHGTHNIYVSVSNTNISVYMDGSLRISYALTSPLSIKTIYLNPRGFLDPGDVQCSTGVSNLKIWADTIDKVSIEYNAGSGNELALHSIYSVNNNYNPKLISPGGVGYKFIINNDSTMILPRPSGNNQIVQIEPISDFLYGVGYFGSGKRISDRDYSSFAIDEDFIYGEAIDGTGSSPDIYDDDINGIFPIGKSLRVVNTINSVDKNLTDDTGLNLTPVAVKMINDLHNPYPTQFFIDPLNAKIIMPRPVYWSKCESENGIRNGEIGTAELNYMSMIFVAGKFGNCVKDQWHGSYGEFYPITIQPVMKVDKAVGIASSFWCASSIPPGYTMYSNFGVYWCFYFNATDRLIVFRDYVSGVSSAWIQVNGVDYGNATIPGGLMTVGELVSVYLIIQNNTIKFSINGVVNYEYTHPSELVVNRLMFWIAGTHYTSAYLYESAIDNIKVWDYIPTTDHALMYSISQIEDALHPMYGVENNYKPNLKVGYYKPSGAGNYVQGKI